MAYRRLRKDQVRQAVIRRRRMKDGVVAEPETSVNRLQEDSVQRAFEDGTLRTTEGV